MMKRAIRRALYIAAGPLLWPMEAAEVRAWHRAALPYLVAALIVSAGTAFFLASGYLDWDRINAAQPGAPAPGCQVPPEVDPFACLR